MQDKKKHWIRSTEKPESKHVTQMEDFPIDTPGVIYVRQSTITQVQKNLHSFEMQTENFVEHFRNMGVTKHIEIIADDEGKSGTLDIHDREGLTRVQRLIEGKELIQGERIGWVGAVHVNRLTRDPWLITPAVLMKDFHDYGVWLATLRMNFNFEDEYCKRVFMLEAEESARHLKWMRDILGGGLKAASHKGSYDGRPVLPGYIVDYKEYFSDGTKNPTYHKYVVYEPHAQIIRWLFKRYIELDGNLPGLYREIEAMPYLFPPFEAWVERKNVSRFSGHRSVIKEGIYKGYYKQSSYGILTILTNPVYLGWWIPLNGGLIEDNHPAIVDATTFNYAHARLSLYDLAGKRQKPKRVVRNGAAEGLLKKVACSPYSHSWIYTRMENRHREKLLATYACYQFNGLLTHPIFAISAYKIDKAFTAKFFERLQEWQSSGELDRWKEKLEGKQLIQNERIGQIKKAIKEAEKKMQRINEVILDLDNPPSKAQEIALKKTYAELADKVEALQKDMHDTAKLEGSEEEEAASLYHIREFIPKIQARWDSLTFDEKLAIVGAFTRNAIFDIPASGWIKLEVEWKIGQKDIMHLQRPTNGERWTEEDDAILKSLYAEADGAEILHQFPTRSWKSIKKHAARDLGLKRTITRNSILLDEFNALSLEGKKYAQENGLETSDKNPQWGRDLR